ncbi:MAG TPA: hypothetical protein VK427_13560, partial [Kofleriaceae bacterium]|nr:hypothetical protein [Kofleriaceae bacterium]
TTAMPAPLDLTCVLAVVAACGGGAATVQPPRPVVVLEKKIDLADLEQPARPKLLDIDWSTVVIASSADALSLWARIAPTGLDWEDKLGELPDAVQRPLAVALIEGGNFACMPPVPPSDCAAPAFDVKEPAPTAGFADPCLRRLLGLWAVNQLDDADLPRLRPALGAMVAIPPPESELVAAVLGAVPEDDHALRLELVAHAWRAGQRDVAAAAVGKLDEPRLIEAVTKHHIDSAVEILSADGHRATYLAAVVDEQLGARARMRAMVDLAAIGDKLPDDVRAALVKAARARDCSVAATAARLLARAGDMRFVPVRPRGATTSKLMRALCVLASYERDAPADEPSLLAGYVPRRGLERVRITYDPLSDTDDDGDGIVHTTHDAVLVPLDQLAVPEVEDLVSAFARCTGTVCKSDEHAYRFTFKRSGGQLVLTRLEIAERPPCPKP